MLSNTISSLHIFSYVSTRNNQIKLNFYCESNLCKSTREKKLNWLRKWARHEKCNWADKRIEIAISWRVWLLVYTNSDTRPKRCDILLMLQTHIECIYANYCQRKRRSKSKDFHPRSTTSVEKEGKHAGHKHKYFDSISEGGSNLITEHPNSCLWKWVIGRSLDNSTRLVCGKFLFVSDGPLTSIWGRLEEGELNGSVEYLSPGLARRNKNCTVHLFKEQFREEAQAH